MTSSLRSPAKSDTLSTTARLYVWSVVVEPLLMFTFSEATKYGFTPNVSKLMQVIVASILTIRFLAHTAKTGLGAVSIVNVSHPYFINFKRYFLLALFSGFIGVLVGAYRIPKAYDTSFADYSAFSSWLNSADIRPIIEYIVTLYYFLYFSILPKYLLNNKLAIDYFFHIFRVTFIACVVLGVIDLALQTVAVDFLPRHFGEGGFIKAGVRFHGIAGEPRDAFVYLFLGLAIFHLRACYLRTELNRWWILIVLSCAVATQSASGIVGIVLFGLLYLIFGTRKMNFGNLVITVSICVIGLIAIYSLIIEIDRFKNYMEAGKSIWGILESKEEIPYLMAVQMVNIYPIYDLTLKIRDFDFFPVLIGSGLGSASAINNFIPSAIPILQNPHAQITRALYESGVIGTYLFVMVFVGPVFYVARRCKSNPKHFVFFTLLLLGCFFGHRSSVSFVYLGIFLAVFQNEVRSKHSVLKNVAESQYRVQFPPGFEAESRPR